MKYIYLCVNYDSSEILKTTIPIWRKYCAELDIYVVDNFKSVDERKKIVEICKSYNATVIYNKNDGYGAALNKGIDTILSSCSFSSDSVLFFGNADIIPVCPIVPTSNNGVPVLNIYHEKRLLNPFLTRIESNFIWILCLSARYRSKTLLLIWNIFRKLIKPFRGGSVAAVHGSLFCLSMTDVKKIHPIFSSNVFLYCEELFFMKKIKDEKLCFTDSTYVFEHIGSVSTGKTIKLNKKEFFDNWCKSMRAYCDDQM